MWIAAKFLANGLWMFLKGLPWQLWVGVGVLVLGLFYGHLRYNAGQAEAQGRLDAYQAKMVAATDAARTAAKRAETAQRGAIAAALSDYKKGLDDAKAKGAGVTSGIKSGAIGLRDHWKGCPGGLPGTPTNPQGSDESAELRAESAGRIVGTGATADAQVIALQAIIASAPHCFTIK